MELEKKQALMRAALWTLGNKRILRKTLRELVETEENCMVLLQELDRIQKQVFQARSMGAEATLTLVEWLDTLNHFDWLCAYCQSRPFRVLSHFIALPVGGTTASNCIPACFTCRRYRDRGKNILHVQAYLVTIQRRNVEITVMNEGNGSSIG